MNTIKLTISQSLLIFVLAAGLLVSGCSPGGEPEPSPEVVRSSVKRVSAPESAQGDLAQLAAGNNAFMLDLYQQLKDKPGNLFTSPYSISSALAMTFAGARGETEAQMASGLHFLLPQEKLHPAFNSLDQILSSREEADLPEDSGDPFQLTIANAIWGQQDFQFEDAFLDTLARYYGAGLRLLDFQAQPEESRQVINEWVSQKTEEKIQDLIPQGAITSDIRLVLSNAIYFNASWMEPFVESLTEDGTFTTLDGAEVTVPMMSQDGPENYLYLDGEGFRAVELPYVGGEVAMLVILPDEGEFTTFEKGFSVAKYQEIVDGLSSQSITLRMPKFEFESEFSLADTLSNMGMPLPFSTAADFSGMTGGKDLYISDVFHKAFISVDEKGTEAAAATAVLMELTALPASPIDLEIDQPFLFLIRDRGTGAVLFLGRVVDPAS